MHGLELIALDVAPGVAMESQSGLQMNRPRVYGALAGPKRGRIGAIVMHPDRKSTRLNSSHSQQSRMPSSA